MKNRCRTHRFMIREVSVYHVRFNVEFSRQVMNFPHRAELCDTSGIFTGAMVLNLKDRDDKGHDTMKKTGRIGKDPPAFLFFHSLTI